MSLMLRFFFFMVIVVPVFLFLGLKGLEHAILSSSRSVHVEPKPAAEIAGTLRKNLRRYFRWRGVSLARGLGRITDYDAYYHNHALYLHMKINTKEQLIPSELPYDLVQKVREKLHNYAAAKMCPFLNAAIGARRMNISIVKQDLTESISITIYKNECQGEA